MSGNTTSNLYIQPLMQFEELLSQVKALNDDLRAKATSAVNVALTARNWLIGAWIVEYEQNGQDRAKYGEKLIEELSHGAKIKGLSETNLKKCRMFYLMYGRIRQSLTAEFPNALPVNILTDSEEPPEDGEYQVPAEQILRHLSFTHIVELMREEHPLKRTFYEIETIRGNWSVRELKRQRGSFLFERMGLSTDKAKLRRIIEAKADTAQPIDVIRDPYLFEFLGLRPQDAVEESEVEKALLNNLQHFLLELGRGFCFEARQMRMQIGLQYYFADLVFYHRLLKCHVIIDIKIGEFEHSHAGQLNTYVNYFRKNMMAQGDNPPIGILLCSEKDTSLVEYALGGMDQQLFVSKYQLELPADDIQDFFGQQVKKLGL